MTINFEFIDNAVSQEERQTIEQSALHDLKESNKSTSKDDLLATMADLVAEVHVLNTKLQIAQKYCGSYFTKLHVAENRLSKLEVDARAIGVEDLMVRYQEISKSTRVLWITTPNVALVNTGTFANINDRLRRLCPFLDAVFFTYGDFDIKEVSDEDLSKAGLMRIPNPTNWDRNSITEELSKLVDTAHRHFLDVTNGGFGGDF